MTKRINTIKNIFVLIFIFFSINLYAQCSNNIEFYGVYFNDKTKKYDQIEGIWQVSRTMRIFNGQQIQYTKKESITETWIITKEGSSFIVCNTNQKELNYKIEFEQYQENRYLFKKTYLNIRETIEVYTSFSNLELLFSYKENNLVVKNLLGEKYNSNYEIYYDYQLKKVQSTNDNVKSNIPKFKKWLYNSIKDYFTS